MSKSSSAPTPLPEEDICKNLRPALVLDNGQVDPLRALLVLIPAIAHILCWKKCTGEYHLPPLATVISMIDGKPIVPVAGTEADARSPPPHLFQAMAYFFKPKSTQGPPGMRDGANRQVDWRKYFAKDPTVSLDVDILSKRAWKFVRESEINSRGPEEMPDPEKGDNMLTILVWFVRSHCTCHCRNSCPMSHFWDYVGNYDPELSARIQTKYSLLFFPEDSRGTKCFPLAISEVVTEQFNKTARSIPPPLSAKSPSSSSSSESKTPFCSSAADSKIDSDPSDAKRRRRGFFEALADIFGANLGL